VRHGSPLSKSASAGERWTFCDAGHVHWGAHGGAGLLFRYVPQEGLPSYLLQQRSPWVDEGGT
jgi:8-oxo-dGTP diphosphatase